MRVGTRKARGEGTRYAISLRGRTVVDCVNTKVEADTPHARRCACGCPCEVEAPPTHGLCESPGAWGIERGRDGDVRLDGLGIGVSARRPGPLLEGNGTAFVFLDERANERQWEALTQMVGGRAGGRPFELIVQWLSNVEIRSRPSTSESRVGTAVPSSVPRWPSGPSQSATP